MSVASVILAAGYGTRMKSVLPKVLHPLAGRSMIEWCVRAAQQAGVERPVVVVGHGREQVMAALGDSCQFATQEQLLGTAHALMQAQPVIGDGAQTVLVTYGDMPLLRGATLQKLHELFVANQRASNAAFAMLTITRADPQGFGRIVRDEHGAIEAIVEEVDCTPAQKRITELNPGIYCFDAVWLWRALPLVQPSAKGEYYLTDLVALARSQGYAVLTAHVDNAETDGVNTRVHLAQAEAALRRRILEQLMLNGVTITDPNSTWVDDTVTIGSDTTILPGCLLQGDTQIGTNCVIGPHTQIVASTIGDGCRVVSSLLEDARMDAGSQMGPFSHLRKGAHLGEHVHMGNFGEVKNSYLAAGVHMGHFSYVGDAEIGENVNIGAGTITCNYDGVRKHKTVVGKDVFIGSDSLLVAPLTIGDGARTGAGSVVTRDVPAGALVYGVPARPPKSKGDAAHVDMAPGDQLTGEISASSDDSGTTKE